MAVTINTCHQEGKGTLPIVAADTDLKIALWALSRYGQHTSTYYHSTKVTENQGKTHSKGPEKTRTWFKPAQTS
jgi:hypothetical protein